MQQQEQHEEWIRRHTWGATMMGQGDHWETPHEDGLAMGEERDDLLEDEEAPIDTSLPPPTPRIVEGTLVESTVLVPPPPPSCAQAGSYQHPAHPLLRWVRQSLVILLVALCTALALTPTQPRVMRLFVSLVPAAGAKAIVTLITDQVDLQRSYILLAVPAGVAVPLVQPPPQAQIEARLLAVPTLTQQVTVPTTGRGHQPATQAHGWITFYNQAPAAQTIPTGILLSGANGIRVVTDHAVIVPAAHLPSQGQVTVYAHTVQTGPQGNIGANDLDGLCCFAGIAVQNAQAFVGGQNARDFPAVGERDVSRAATPLMATLTNQGQAAVQAQLRADEQLVRPVQCAPQVIATPAIGEEATQVTVAVRVTCRAEVYNAEQAQAQVTELLSQEATTHLGSAYVLQGEVTPTVSTITTIDARKGIVAFQVQVEGVWAYQLGAAQLHRLTTLVSSKPLQQARSLLLHTQGIHQVTVTSTDWWDDASQQTLPPDPNRIQIVVISWAGM